MAAAMRCHELGLSCLTVDANRMAMTVVEMYKGKILFAEPENTPNHSSMWFEECTREELLDRWRGQVEEVGLEVREHETSRHGTVSVSGDELGDLQILVEVHARSLEALAADTPHLPCAVKLVGRAAATLGIAENISGVAQAADEQTAGVNKNFSAARGLAEMADEVRRYVDEFKVSDDRPSGDQAGGESNPLSRVAAAAVDPMVVSPTPASRAAAA